MAQPGIGGYVLAGGRSSRMGRDKAMLQLAGKPLVQRAVTRLRQICVEVHVLGGSPELEQFAPLVHDLHPGCGPIGGLEAALNHSRHTWNLFTPVDVPFLPAAFLQKWARQVTTSSPAARVALFTVQDIPQPLLCLLHQETLPFVREAVERGEFKVLPVLERAGRELAQRHHTGFDKVLLNTIWDQSAKAITQDQNLTEAQQRATHLWFANLNTPEEFAQAEQNSQALDT